MARFRYHPLPPITPPHISYQRVERRATRILVGERMEDAVGIRRPLKLPLIGPVVIDPNNIEMAGTSASLRQKPSTQHIPRLKDQPFIEMRDLFDEIAPVWRVHDSTQWIHINEAR
jgi:hypothetical protein